MVLVLVLVLVLPDESTCSIRFLKSSDKVAYVEFWKFSLEKGQLWLIIKMWRIALTS